MKTHGLYLNGRWAEQGDPIEVVNPATREPIARVSTCGRETVAQALADAQRAFESWRETPAIERGDALLAVARQMEQRAEEIARTMTRENGKPLKQSRAEVTLSIDHLRWFAEEGRRAFGRIIPQQKAHKRHLVIKSPVGVVGAITPWNFPLLLAVRKVAPALAAGCPVVLKPAGKTPLCAVALAECVHAAHLPPGLFQLVLGKSQEIADELMDNPICRKITFTGSTEVGQKLIEGAARQVKRLSLELGGHAPVLVFDDADLDRTLEAVMMAKFRNTGQSCIAANRIFVQAGIYDRFVKAFVDRVRAMKIGDGMDENVDIGPLIDTDALNGAMKQINDAVKRGAKLLCGGKRWEGGRGCFLEPAVLENVPDDAECMREETFAPVAPVARFEKEEQAIAGANATRYGLSAYVFTRDIDRMWRLIEQVEAGMICVNDGVPTTSNAPFGGMKQSGWGRELGSEGLEAFLETKHISYAIA